MCVKSGEIQTDSDRRGKKSVQLKWKSKVHKLHGMFTIDGGCTKFMWRQSCLWASSFYILTSMAGVLSQHWRGLPALLTGIPRDPQPHLPRLCWINLLVHARVQTVYTPADLVLSHTAEVSLHVLAQQHSSIQDVESGDQIKKKKSFPSFLPEDSRRGSVSVAALARSTRSAFLARCHPKIEVSAEQQIRHKTYENSYSIISLLWKKIKLTNRKGRMELKRGVGFLPIASVSSYRPLPLLVFFFYPALQPREMSSEMSCVYMESGAEPL